MLYVFIILICIIAIIALLYFHGIWLSAFVIIDREIRIRILWNYPFLQASIALDKAVPVLEIYIFKLRIIKMRIANKKRTFPLKRLIRSMDVSHIRIKTVYGLNNPFLTGIICGAFNAFIPLVDIEKITHMPDFSSEKDYILIEAEGFINVRHSILNFVKNKNKKEIFQWSKT